MNKYKTIFQPVIFGLLGLLVLSSCRKDLSSDIPEDYNTVDGWAYYADGDYSSALDAFQLTSERNAQTIEAYIGKGWSYLRLGHIQHSRVEFSVVLNLANENNDDVSMADAYAGLFLIALENRFSAQTDPEQEPTEEDLIDLNNKIIEMGEKVFVYNSDYSTNHDPDLSSDEVHIALAQTYYNVSRYQEALEHAQPVFGNILDQIDAVETVAIELNPWIGSDGELQLFNFSETEELTSVNIPTGHTISVDDIQDLNNSNATVKNELFDYLLNHNVIELNSDYLFTPHEERVYSVTVSHAQPGSASQDYSILSLEKQGVFQVESVQKITLEDVVTWYYVDANNDTTLADGTYEDDGTGDFFSVITEEEIFTDVDGSIWTPVDPDTDTPVDTVGVIPYNYNMINLSSGAEGDEYLVTYKFGSYLVDCTQTINFLGYLELLNSYLSLD